MLSEIVTCICAAPRALLGADFGVLACEVSCAPQWLQNSTGLLEPLAAEAGDADDLLGCAAALQLIVQLAQQSGPAADALLGGSLLPNLRKLVTRGDPFLKGQAVQVSHLAAIFTCCRLEVKCRAGKISCKKLQIGRQSANLLRRVQALGALLAATVATGAGDLQVQHPGSSHTLCAYVLGLLDQVLSAESEEEVRQSKLSTPGDEFTRQQSWRAPCQLGGDCLPAVQTEVQSAALDAISQISVSKRGAELLALHGSIPGHVASRALTVRGEQSYLHIF